jgi:hypothetical protein
MRQLRTSFRVNDEKLSDPESILDNFRRKPRKVVRTYIAAADKFRGITVPNLF